MLHCRNGGRLMGRRPFLISLNGLFFTQWHGLRDIVLPILTIFVWPPENFRYIPCPIAMPGQDRSSPLERVCLPGVGILYVPALSDGIEEVEEEQELRGKYDDRDDGYKSVQPIELGKAYP